MPFTARPTQQDDSSSSGATPPSQWVHLEHRCGLASTSVETGSELEMYFDVALWGLHPAPGDFQLETCLPGTPELEKRDKDRGFEKKRRKGSRFQRLRIIFTLGILKSRKGGSKDREGEGRRRNLKDTISAPLKSRIL